mmetsp:Transcript_50295/g.80091  ORF Transcript_50295/g.80091 Transcript_50295/m.80091 type:complete len:108 (+) Transcript_50295:716-1039(+)
MCCTQSMALRRNPSHSGKRLFVSFKRNRMWRRMWSFILSLWEQPERIRPLHIELRSNCYSAQSDRCGGQFVCECCCVRACVNVYVLLQVAVCADQEMRRVFVFVDVL